MTKLHALPAPKPRISAKIRAAVDFRVREGLSIQAAAEKAGLSRNGFAKALKRPAVLDHLEEVQRRFVAESDAKRVLYRARAFEVALDLMLNAKSEAIRARMAEFLATDGKTPQTQIAVNVDARQDHIGRGYEYIRPGQKIEVVEITGGDRSAEPAEG